MVCNALADQHRRVIVAGLDQDYLGKPFEPMPQLLAIAEYITKTHAVCVVCGEPANHTQRLVQSRERVARRRAERLRSPLSSVRSDARRAGADSAAARGEWQREAATARTAATRSLRRAFTDVAGDRDQLPRRARRSTSAISVSRLTGLVT